MAIMKKTPVKKMQEGGKVKIKIKVKPDRKAIKEDKNKAPMMSPLREAESSIKKLKLDKSVKDTGFKAKELKKGGAVKAKNGKSFPDLNKDGKITKADILKGRGVFAKKGAAVKKKMQYGGEAASMVPAMKSGGKMKKAGMHKMPDGSMMKNSKMKSGGSMKKCRYGCK